MAKAICDAKHLGNEFGIGFVNRFKNYSKNPFHSPRSATLSPPAPSTPYLHDQLPHVNPSDSQYLDRILWNKTRFFDICIKPDHKTYDCMRTIRTRQATHYACQYPPPLPTHGSPHTTSSSGSNTSSSLSDVPVIHAPILLSSRP